MISPSLKFVFLWTGALLLTARSLAAAQFIVSTNAGDEFRSLGRDTNGTVWIAGARNGIATLFQFTGGNFNAATLAELVSGETYASSISRDARRVVGISGDEAVLWDVSSPGAAQGLGFPVGQSFSAAHGVSSSTSPTVIGFTGSGSFIWSASSGIQPFSNPPGHFQPRLTGISADGQTIIGYAGASGPTTDSFVYQGGTSSFLNELGGNRSGAYSVSTNGNAIGGDIDGQGAIWRKGTTNWQDSIPLRLSINNNPVGQVSAVSDTGFAVGSGLNGGFISGYIHDPRTGVTSWFDDWWQNETGSAVPQHVTIVNDVYEAGGQIYFALTLTNGVALASLAAPLSAPSLTIARLPSGDIELRWTTNRACTVESTLDLTPPRVWTPRTNPAPVLSGSQFVLALPATNAMSFFRLNCP